MAAKAIRWLLAPTEQEVEHLIFLPVIEHAMRGFLGEGEKVDLGVRISCQHMQRLPRAEPVEGAFALQDRQRTIQAAGIEFVVKTSLLVSDFRHGPSIPRAAQGFAGGNATPELTVIMRRKFTAQEVTAPMPDDKKYSDAVDPRSFTDKRILEEHSREEVERWRKEAHERHRQWMSVMQNSYGKD